MGAGHNETNVFDSTEEDPNTGNLGTQDHDIYTVGQFKDDQMQNHAHQIWAHGYDANSTSHGSTAGDDSTASHSYKEWMVLKGREGTTTHGKQLGVNYIIKSA